MNRRSSNSVSIIRAHTSGLPFLQEETNEATEDILLYLPLLQHNYYFNHQFLIVMLALIFTVLFINEKQMQ